MVYQTNDILKVMEEESGVQIRTLKVDGGASNNNFLMQFQADILGVDVLRPQCVETTALGAAYLAGIAVGYWEDVEDVRANWALSRTFHADMTDEKETTFVKRLEESSRSRIRVGGGLDYEAGISISVAGRSDTDSCNRMGAGGGDPCGYAVMSWYGRIYRPI